MHSTRRAAGGTGALCVQGRGATTATGLVLHGKPEQVSGSVLLPMLSFPKVLIPLGAAVRPSRALGGMDITN